MPAPYTHYVDVTVSLTPQGAPQASFSVPAFINANAIGGSVLQGPYTSVQDVVTAGFAAGSAMHDFATALMQQNPRPRSFYSIKDTGGGPAAALSAAVAINPGAFYGIAMESRDTDDILATAAVVETLRKIAIFQSSEASMIDDDTGPSYEATFGGTPTDGTYRLIFTGFGLGAPVNVDVVRAGGVPADNTALGVALDAALDTALAGSLATVLAPGTISNALGVVSFSVLDGLAAGTITVTDPESPDGLEVEIVDGDIASRLFQLQYTRSALCYYATDDDMLAERFLARCLGNDLDTQQLSWSYKPLVGIAGSTLQPDEIAVLRAANVNYFSTAISSAGQLTSAFTAQGVFPVGTSGAGRLIRVQTSIDWLHARKEEALLSVFLREPDAVFLDNAGINRFVAASKGVNTTGLGADHLIEKVVPEGEDFAGEKTPLIIAPDESEITTADRETGTLRMQELLYLKPSAEKVVLVTEVRQ